MKFDLSASLSDAVENENGFLRWYGVAGRQHDAYLFFMKKRKEDKIDEKSWK